MTETAEEALAGLARDLIEEIAVGRALELAQDDPDGLQLAMFNVRPFQRRSPTGKVEQVRGHTENRLGTGMPEGWIPQPDWLKGQQEWEKAGEAAWKAHEAARRAGAPPGEQIPEPKKGAAAVHPQLHHGTVRLPGDTISGHAHAHVPKPFEVKQPTAQDIALGEAHAALAVHRQATLQRIAAGQAAAEAARSGIPAPGTYAPLTDEQFDTHTRNLERAIGRAMQEGLATDHQFTEPGNRRIWDPDRAEQHAGIVKDYLDKQVNVPSQRAALFMGGLPGAGKSTLLKHHQGIDLKDYAVINPDDFKEELARRDMIPEVEGLSPMERVALVHEESVHLANLAAAELQRRGKNLAYDVTMKSYRQTANRVKWLKEKGYHVTAVFVDVPVEKSVERVAKRYRQGLEFYRQGTDKLGGRYVPAYAVRSGEGEPGQPSRARATFDSLRPQFDRWELYDGTKGVATLAEQGGKQPPPGGISSVEELVKQQQARALDTEAAARKAEKGTAQ